MEEVAGRWLKELLGIPAHASFALVTGCQVAHSTALAAARRTKRHGTLDRALRFLGLGTGSVRPIAADGQGRMDVDALRADLARDAAGADRADSWATDAHKWLNVPYDSGIAFCARPEPHTAPHSGSALPTSCTATRTPRVTRWTGRPSTRGARARSRSTPLCGRSAAVASPTWSTAANARAIAGGLSKLPGCEILNEVVLNQVLLRFEDDATTDRVVAAVQASGEAWMGGTRTIAAFAAARR